MRKINVLVAATLVAATFSTGAAALSDLERSYVLNGTMGVLANTICDAKLVKNGLVKLADRNGLDNERLRKAVVAALAVNFNMEYDRDDLIPAVTSLLNSAMMVFAEELEKDKKGTCLKYIKILRITGIVE